MNGFVNDYKTWEQATKATSYFTKLGFFAVQTGLSVVVFPR